MRGGRVVVSPDQVFGNNWREITLDWGATPDQARSGQN